MTGAEDLGRHGQWQQTPEYGALWVPSSVPSGWAPYSVGRWAWVRPWGWTWIDDAPWGFAPFHYGRWVYHRDVWGWAPGTYVARPVYAPALVAWVGGPRANLSISIGSGAPVGWFPLAPREVYVPAYRSSPRYQRDINFTHVGNAASVTAIVSNRNGEADRREFANRRYAHAVTFVPAEVMTRREPVGPAAARLRNDPKVRAFVADAGPAHVHSAAPVDAPAAPRPTQGRTPPRPPFEGRAPGGAGARPDSSRGRFGRSVRTARHGADRHAAARHGTADMARPDMAGADMGRTDTARPDMARPDAVRSEAPRGPGGRPDFVRPGEGSSTTPPRATPQVATPAAPVTAAPQTVAPAAGPAVIAPQAATLPGAGGAGRISPAPAGPPFGARGNAGESMNGRSTFRGDMRQDREAGPATAPERIAPASPALRSAQPGEPIGRAGREMRVPEGVAPEGRAMRPPNASPYGAAAPGQISEGMIPQRPIPREPCRRGRPMRRQRAK